MRGRDMGEFTMTAEVRDVLMVGRYAVSLTLPNEHIARS